MTKTEASAPPGRAWAAVLGSAIALSVCNGPIAVFAFGTFIPPLTAEFGWGRGQVSLGVTLFNVCLGLVVPFFGLLIDRYGLRGPQLLSLASFAGLLACVSLIQSLPLFLLLFALMGFASPGATPVPYSKVVAAWFNRRRGTALGLAVTGIGIGGMIMPPLCAALLGAYGWRGGFAMLGLIVALVSLPAVFFFIHEPSSRPLSPKRASVPPAVGWTEMLSERRFWLIAVSAGLIAAATGGTLVHLPPMLKDVGLAPAAVASLLTAAGFASLVGRLTTGVLLDLFFAPFVAAAAFVFAALGLIFLSIDSIGPLTWMGVLLVGFALGAEIDIAGYLVSRYFPLATYGRVYGAVFLLFSLGNGLGAFVSGFCYDLTGSYRMALHGFCGSMLLSAGMVLMLGPYRFSFTDPARQLPDEEPQHE